MKANSSRVRLCVLALGVVLVIAVHGIFFYYVVSHLALSAAVVAGAIILVAVKHLGLLGPAYTLIRRRRLRE